MLGEDIIEFLTISLKFEQDAFKIMAEDPEHYAPMAAVWAQSLQDRVPMWDMLSQFKEGDNFTDFTDALNSLYRVQNEARRRRLAAHDVVPTLTP